MRIAGTISLIVLLAAAAVVPFLGALLEYQDPPQRADYIVTFAGDRTLVQKATELYQQGYSAKVLLGRVDDPAAHTATTGARTETDIPARALDGVPASVATLFASGHADLADAAAAVRSIVEDRRVKIILVTPRAQSWRAKMMFEDEMPRARFFLVLPEEGRIGVPWWTDRESALLTVTETTKLVHYWVSNLRSSQSATRPHRDAQRPSDVPDPVQR